MTLKEAMLSNKWFTKNGYSFSRYFLADTGPDKGLVSCDYFIHKEDGQAYFSTSIDLYASDIFSEEYWTVDVEPI